MSPAPGAKRSLPNSIACMMNSSDAHKTHSATPCVCIIEHACLSSEPNAATMTLRVTSRRNKARSPENTSYITEALHQTGREV